MKEWFTPAELAEAKLPGLPHSQRGINLFIEKSGARSTGLARQRGGQGGGFEYHYRLLPTVARQKLAFLNTELPAQKSDVAKLLWRKYDALTTQQKAVCQKRLDVLVDVDGMRASGISAEHAIKHATHRADIAAATYYEWRKMVEGHARQDWLAALAPSTSPIAEGLVAELSECHPDAWDVLASDFLRSEGPAFSACYRRMEEVAKKKGWAPIPHERTLRRRMDILVPRAVQILARKGKEEAKKLFPAQQRSVAHLQAMQMVNTDGHKLDLHVRFPGREKWGRVFLMATQDIYSRKILSWVLCEAETWEAVRTIVGNMVETHGIPGRLYMDNGRAFASTKISGGAKRRNRFKISEDEVAGLLKTLGIDPRFVNPYSGQSKPIERGWGDLAENISKHPAMAGCYTGRSTQHKPENYGKDAVSIDELEKHVAMCVEEHNTRLGRKTETAKGMSFEQVFAASIADPANEYVRFASPAQRSLWMLTAETVTARKPNGAVHLFENRYWHQSLNQWIGKKLTVRFDPSDLHGSVKIYDPQGRFLCDADCIEKTGFDCAVAAREISRARSAKKKNDAAALKSARRLSDLELNELMGRGAKPAPVKPARPTVTRLITRTPVATQPAQDIATAIDDQQFEDSFSRGLARLAGGDAAIIKFPKGDRPKK
ncbi:DDE-type integrase/transposase/recombinase [Rhizobium sp. P38BS-XIX]|uniref:transposase domain-containing protein n=1 Tax=Rhizobium sp. P38BS-XIX TaxID=2726740 RepID=UPI001456C5BC|nr:transposase domain-containing protein [Rhizobium sp. P38BS-XIX]NLS00210.1 DDE-type integrase/transposase/recombinase [Rhizobium sp. P38BS-XIX]